MAGMGLCGYLQVGSLSSLGQVNSIILMAAGGSIGILCFIGSIVGSVKKCQARGHAEDIESGSSLEEGDSKATNVIGENKIDRDPLFSTNCQETGDSKITVLIGEDSNITFLVKKESIKANREHLFQHSAYFKTMLGGNFKETGQKKIVLNDFDPDAFKEFLAFLEGHQRISDDPNIWIASVGLGDLLVHNDFIAYAKANLVSTISADQSGDILENDADLFFSLIPDIGRKNGWDFAAAISQWIKDVQGGRSAQKATPQEREQMISKAEQVIKDLDSLFPYGPRAYLRAWNVEVVEEAPLPPEVDETKRDPFFNAPLKENFPLIYFPNRIRFPNGQEVDVTLNTLKQISGKPFHLSDEVKRQFGDIPLQPGWRRVSRDIIPRSRNQTYDIQKRMVEGNEDYRLQQALEVAVFMQLVKALTGGELYGEGTYTRCIEKVDGKYPVVVGGFDSDGLIAYDSRNFDVGLCGVACVLRK